MLQLAGLGLDAISVGGLETCIQVPGWDLAFDIGRCPRSAVHRGRVFFTHAHIDHLGGIAQHAATRSLLGLTPPVYGLHPALIPDVEVLLDAWRRLDGSELLCELVPIQPGDSLELGRDIVIRPFLAPHRVRCQGYAIWRRRRKLLPELVGQPQEAIRARRMRGEPVSHDALAPELAFTGDSLIEVVEREPAVRQARVLVIEVTFYDERVSVAQCRSKGHIHLDEVIEREELFENEAILFTHLSARYSGDEAAAILDRRLPPRLRERVTLLRPPEHVWQS